MICAAIEVGLDGMAFTDHHRLVPAEHLADLNRKYAPFRIFTGVEISVIEGEDVLVLGVYDSALESLDWRYPALHAFVRRREGFLVLAHPFRFHDQIALDLERYPIDGIEVHSKNMSGENVPAIRDTIRRFGLRPLCNSDAHGVEDVGVYYNHLVHSAWDDGMLLELLRAGEYACQGLAEWTPVGPGGMEEAYSLSARTAR